MARDVSARGSVFAAAGALAVLFALAGCETPPTGIPTADSVRGLKPSGSVTMTELYLSATGLGSGTLTLRGRTYAFTMIGELIGLGALSGIEARGEVYNLRDLSQFSGAYIQGAPPLAAGSLPGEVWLRNNHGVVMRLTGLINGITVSSGRYELFINLTR
jgi:hypothetical protein